MKVELKVAGLLGISGLVIIFLALSLAEPWQIASQWLAQASVLWAWVWRATSQRSNLNRLSATAPLLETLGWANRLTLLRGYLIALTGGFLFQPQTDGIISWAPGLLYGAAAILDRVDGFVARKSKQTTLLGAELDMVFDALGLLIVPLLAISFGKVHWSYLLLSFAFYIFQWGLYVRRRRELAIYPLIPSQLRRALAGFQMGFIALVLFPCFLPPQTLLCSVAFMIPVLLGFAVDWLVVTGRINGQAQTAKRFFAALANFSARIFQPALRALLAIGLLYITREMDLSSLSSFAKFSLISGLVFGISLVLLGWAGRVGALIILLLLGTYPISISTLDVVVLCSATYLLLLGTGRFSLWQWDDVWVNRQDGASAES